jgi:hypothetical protein
VRTISDIISKIPGLESLLESITERITMFVMALIAPFIQPIIKAVSASLKTGNNAVVESSAKSQYEVWNDPRSSDPTHSMLSKDHFSNILNEPAGRVASEVLQYVAPRVVYGWENPDVPVHEILNDIVRAFHHPALRDNNIEVQRKMFSAVEDWVRTRQGPNLDQVLNSASVKAGKNHVGEDNHSHGSYFSSGQPGAGSHSKVSGSPFDMFNRKRELGFDDDAPSQANTNSWQGQQSDPTAYSVGTSYQSGYQDGYDPRHGQHQQQQQQQQYGGQQQGGYENQSQYGGPQGGQQQQYGQQQGPPGGYGGYNQGQGPPGSYGGGY